MKVQNNKNRFLLLLLMVAALACWQRSIFTMQDKINHNSERAVTFYLLLFNYFSPTYRFEPEEEYQKHRNTIISSFEQIQATLPKNIAHFTQQSIDKAKKNDLKGIMQDMLALVGFIPVYCRRNFKIQFIHLTTLLPAEERVQLNGLMDNKLAEVFYTEMGLVQTRH